MSKEFKNLLSLLKSNISENIILAFQLAQNYKSEFEGYFGCLVEEYEEIYYFLEAHSEYKINGFITENTYLELQKFTVSEIPKSIVILKEIDYFRWSDNQITIFPVEVLRFNNLSELFLQGNNISFIPIGITQLKNLKILGLNHNQLTKLPEKIGELYNLSELFLECNQLIELPKDMIELENLEILSIATNNFQAFPLEITHYKNLRKLILDNNQIEQFSKQIKAIKEINPLLEIVCTRSTR